MKKEKAKMAAPKKEKKKKIVEETVVTAPKTISVKMVEYYNTMVVHEPIEINVVSIRITISALTGGPHTSQLIS